MILTAYIGNSNIVVGCAEPGTKKIIFEEKISTDREKTSAEYAIIVKTILEIHGIDPKDLEGGIISSSVPPVTEPVREGIERLLDKKMIEVGPGIKTGVDIKLDDPAQLGADLLVGAVAGISLYGAPIILINMGTATTISVIGEDKRFIGGMIIPGIEVSLDGLVKSAAHLPEVAIKKPAKLIGGNTVSAIQSGSIYGHASCIDGMIDRIWEDLGYETEVVATGNLTEEVIPCCRHRIRIDDGLIIKGLTILYEKNTKKKEHTKITVRL